MRTYRKAVVAAAIPVVVAVIMYLVTDTLNAPELALAPAGLLNALVVYEVSNAEEG